MSFGARALIRLGALKHNLNVIRSRAPGARVMAVIKANAYGHGMVAVAKALTDVDAFAVARVPEAKMLRDNGVENDIVLLAGVLDREEMEAVVDLDLQPVVHCREQIDLLRACEAGDVTVWLKFDTGMNRLGFDPALAVELRQELGDLSVVRELRLMSHLSTADERDGAESKQQLRQFHSISADFAGEISLANSAGAFGIPEVFDNPAGREYGNWIRPGIALFGISPFDGQDGTDLGLMPVMQFEARLIAVKPLRKGARVGYRGTYRCTADTMLGVISAGYGDGYTRHFRSGTPVLLNGRKVSVIGNVSMDMIAVDLGTDANDKVGDIAVLWGDGLPVEEVAPWANAIPYELVCGVMNREASEIID